MAKKDGERAPHKKKAKPSNPLADGYFPKTKARLEKRREGNKRLHYELPGVAEHIAKVVLKHALDWRRACRELLGEEASEKLIGDYAEKLPTKPEIQEALKKQLERKGLGDKSRDVFVAKLWDWFLGGDPMKSTTAARLLGKAFIGEQKKGDKPASLPIEGVQEGVKQMLGAVADDLDLSGVEESRVDPDEAEEESVDPSVDSEIEKLGKEMLDGSK